MGQLRLGQWVVLWGVVALSACAQQKVAEDNTPKVSTAVIETRITNMGFKGQFASQGKTVMRTRADMQRIDTDHEFTGAIMKHLVDASAQASIARLDKNLLWELDKNNKKYTECPLAGCGPQAGLPSLPAASDEEDKASADSCPLTMVKNQFDVTETGQTRTINGFNTREYAVVWDVVAEDAKKRQANNRFTVNIWTTPESDDIKQVLHTQDTFAKAYAQKVSSAYAGLHRVIPSEALSMLSNYFFNTLSETDRKALLDVGTKLDKIKGYPISTKVEWYSSGDACQEPKPKEEKKEEKLDLKNGVGGLMSSLAGKFADDKVKKEAAQSKDKPVFGFVEEVKSIKMDMVHDSVMAVPAGYKLENRK